MHYLTLPTSVHYFGYLKITITTNLRIYFQIAPASIYPFIIQVALPSVVYTIANRVEEWLNFYIN